jgi:magnesium chelatase family protein
VESNSPRSTRRRQAAGRGRWSGGPRQIDDERRPRRRRPHADSCRCTPSARERYWPRLSGPLLDRIDLRVFVPPAPFAALRDARPGLSTERMAGDVAGARTRQAARFASARLNASLRPGELRRWCSVDAAGERLLESASAQWTLSARGVGRVLRVARTIADLAAAERIAEAHVLEALRWRAEPSA